MHTKAVGLAEQREGSQKDCDDPTLRLKEMLSSGSPLRFLASEILNPMRHTFSVLVVLQVHSVSSVVSFYQFIFPLFFVGLEESTQRFDEEN